MLCARQGLIAGFTSRQVVPLLFARLHHRAASFWAQPRSPGPNHLHTPINHQRKGLRRRSPCTYLGEELSALDIALATDFRQFKQEQEQGALAHILQLDILPCDKPSQPWLLSMGIVLLFNRMAGLLPLHRQLLLNLQHPHKSQTPQTSPLHPSKIMVTRSALETLGLYTCYSRRSV